MSVVQNRKKAKTAGLAVPNLDWQAVNANLQPDSLTIEAWPTPRLVFCQGNFAPHLSVGWQDFAVQVKQVANGVELQVDANAQSSAVLHVIHCLHTDVAPIQLKNNIDWRIGSQAQLKICEHMLVAGAQPINWQYNSCLHLAAGAQFSSLQLNTLPDNCYLQLQDAVNLQQAALFDQTICDMGAAIVQRDMHINFVAAHSQVMQRTLLCAAERQQQQQNIKVQHQAEHTSSNLQARHILQDKAKGSWAATNNVAPSGQQAEVMQQHRSLLLSNAAQTLSQPCLVINADDVQCAHGSTVGDLDEEALFYLRVRGLSEQAAKELLLQAFAHDLLNSMPCAELKSVAQACLQAHLQSFLQKELA